jgi:uncharacterized protein (DUF362 family)
MGNAVSLVKVNGSETDLKRPVNQALELISFKPNSVVKSVVIKPNLCYYWDYTTGYTTDPHVVAALIDIVREWYGNVEVKVAEADASAMRTRHAFPVLGYEKLAAEKGVELFNLANDVMAKKTVNVHGHDFSFKVPQMLLKADLFINVPKLKVMRATKITCAMKNLFGCMGVHRKIIYHPFLNEAIVGMARLLHPHLTIVDGLIALGSNPKKLGLIMASVDPFSVDWIVSEIAGYKPRSVEFLKIAVKEKVGSPEGIITKGERPDEFAKAFPRVGFGSSDTLWKLQFWLLKAYHKMSGDIIPPVLEEA